ncbi:uncharacterized protein LOC144580564 isoform X2 [Callithrix jacchus]
MASWGSRRGLRQMLQLAPTWRGTSSVSPRSPQGSLAYAVHTWRHLPLLHIRASVCPHAQKMMSPETLRLHGPGEDAQGGSLPGVPERSLPTAKGWEELP